ncbi:hypothetical protein D3C77_618120 [compost metagenome]
MTTTRQPMALQDDCQAIQASLWVAFDKDEFTLMKRAPGPVTDHCRCLAVEAVAVGKLAEHHAAAAAGGVAQANGMAHVLGPGMPYTNGSSPRVC